MLLPLLFSHRFSLPDSDNFIFDHNTTAIKFRQLYLDRGDRIHCRNIPPHTSIVFNTFPKSTFTASYVFNGTSYSLTGCSLTAGFDSGAYTANLTLRAANSGPVVYFAAPFPAHCAIRILTNRAPDSLEMHNTSANICYFNGAERDLNFRISVKTHRSGSLNSQMIQSPLTGESRVSLNLVDPEVISWSGDMETVKIDVDSRSSESQGVFETLTGQWPLFLKTDCDGGFWARLGHPVAVVIETCVTVFGLIAMRVYFLRRQMRQRSMKEDEDLPLIHTCDDQPMMGMEYVSVPSSIGEAARPCGSRLDEIEAVSQSENSDV
jgi:hypothetical protein